MMSNILLRAAHVLLVIGLLAGPLKAIESFEAEYLSAHIEVANDTSRADRLLQQALALNEAAYYDSAHQFFLDATQAYEKIKDWKGWMHCMNQMSFNHVFVGQFDEAQSVLDLAFEKGKEYVDESDALIAENHFVRGQLHYFQNKFDLSKKWLLTSLSIYDAIEPKQDKAIFEVYRILGGIYLLFQQLDSASYYYTPALNLAQQLYGPKDKKVASALFNLGYVKRYQDDLPAALDLYEKAREIHLKNNIQSPTLSNIYQGIAEIQNTKGDFGQALKEAHQAYKIALDFYDEDHLEIANIHYLFGAIHQTRGDWELVIEHFGKAQAIYQKKSPSAIQIPFMLNGSGAAYTALGDNPKGLAHLKRALQLLEGIPKLPSTYIAEVYRNMGALALKQNDASSAKANYETAASLIEEGRGDRLVLSEIKNDLGYLYLNGLNDIEHAVAMFEEELSLKSSVLEENDGQLAGPYLGLGLAYAKDQKFEQAYNHLKKARDIYAVHYGLENTFTSRAELALGELFKSQGSHREAHLHYQKAIESALPGKQEWDQYDNPLKASQQIYSALLIQILHAKAENHGQTHYSENGSLQDLEAALQTYLLSIEAINKLRTDLVREESKLGLADHNAYEKALNIAWELFQNSQDRSFLAQAYQVAAQSKANVLKEALQASQARAFAGIPNDLLEQEHRLSLDIAQYRTQIQKELIKGNQQDTQLVDTFETRLFDLQNQYDALIHRFNQDYPQYYALRHSQSQIDLEKIQSELSNEEGLLVEYFWGDSLLYVFSMDQKDIQWHLPIPVQEVEKLINTFDRGLKLFESKSILQAGYGLYQKLLAPFQGQLMHKEKLTIIPDGPLRNLPFEALFSQPVEGNDIDASLPYLIKEFDISYDFSSSLFLERLDGIQKQNDGFIGFAPVNYEQLPSLAESEKEIQAIADLFTAANRSAQVFLGQSAQESSLKAKAIQQARFLHISTHAEVNEQNPYLSGIILNPSDESEVEDGTLYISEAYNLSLNADLVVLSTCQSKIGKHIKGEGMLGLSRAFLYAGGRNLMASLWDVEDEVTALIMQDFYSNVFDGQSYSQALRQAKLKLIASNTFSYPMDWAPFVLIGQ